LRKPIGPPSVHDREMYAPVVPTGELVANAMPLWMRPRAPAVPELRYSATGAVPNCMTAKQRTTR
jgi:hypothetical protein